jgi:hypothetical protein
MLTAAELTQFERLAGYLILARASELRARPFARDKLYLVAAAVATRSLWPKTAACCRARILQHNPQHGVGRLSTMEQSLRNSEFQLILIKAEQLYPPEHAEYLLAKLNISVSEEQAQFANQRDFLAALLQARAEELDACLE